MDFGWGRAVSCLLLWSKPRNCLLVARGERRKASLGLGARESRARPGGGPCGRQSWGLPSVAIGPSGDWLRFPAAGSQGRPGPHDIFPHTVTNPEQHLSTSSAPQQGQLSTSSTIDTLAQYYRLSFLHACFVKNISVRRSTSFWPSIPGPVCAGRKCPSPIHCRAPGFDPSNLPPFFTSITRGHLPVPSLARSDTASGQPDEARSVEQWLAVDSLRDITKACWRHGGRDCWSRRGRTGWTTVVAEDMGPGARQ